MNNSMNFFKRLTAFLLAMLLVTTMRGDDFFSFAEDPAVVTESSGGEAAAAPASEGGGDFVDVSTPVVEATPEAAPVAEEAAPAVTGSVETQATPEEATPAENPTEITSETNTTDGATPALDENGNPISSEDIDNPEVTKDPTTEDAEEDKDKEDKDKEDEDKDKEDEDKDKAEDKDCEHAEWSYSSNGDGTHKKICAECGEEQVEACTFNEDGVCIHCGYEKPKEEEECEHEWEYVSNGNGTHKKICKKCGEMAGEESCTYDEDLVCIHCGYQDECEHEEWEYVSNEDGTHKKICKRCHIEEVEECTFGEDRKCTHCGYEKECEHEEWEYTSNEDGTHTKRCKECGYEEIENCEFDENWVCKHCGYEDMTLVYQEYSKTIHGVKVTVSGQMPRKSNVTIYTRSLGKINAIVNESLAEGAFNAYEAFDINIYDRHGNKYQPQDDGSSVNVTFSGVEELAENDGEEIVAFRIEDDDATVTEIPSDVAGEDVSFDAEHFSTYAVGTISTNLYAQLSGYQSFAYIAQATENYTRVDGTTFYVYFPSSSGGSNTFTATYYKGLTDSSNPTSGTAVSTTTVPVSATSSGYYKVDVTFDDVASNDDAWVTKGNYYSVVITMTSSCQIGYGSGSTKTYIKTTSGTYARNATYDGIFQENITTASTISDSYTVHSIAPTSATADSSGQYHYAKGETDTFTATLSADVERTIEWTSSNTSVATIDSNGKLTAEAPGTTTIRGTYNSTYKEVTVNVISISIGRIDIDSVGSTASYATEYTGSAIRPEVWVYTSASDYLTTNSSSITAIYDTNDEVTNVAHVKVSYKVDSKSTYSYDRYFKITAIDITKTDTNSKTAFDDAKYTILNGEITAVTNVNSNSILNVTPSFTNGDFTVTVNGTESTQNGIAASLTVKGTGNFSGTVNNVSTTIEGTDISDLFTVKLSSTSKLKDCYYTGADYTLTETDTGWSEVTFYDVNGATSTGVITPDSAYVTIVNAGTTTEDAKNAGAKTIIFTMKDGQAYTGSISVNFTIQKASLNSVSVNWVTVAGENEGNNFYHKTDSSAVEPTAGTHFNVTLNGNAIDTTEYNVSYPTSNHTDIGQTCTLYLSSAGVNFTSGTSKSETYYIIGKYANDLVIRITDDNGNTYDGTASDYATGYAKYYDGTADTPTINAYMPGVGNLNKVTEVTIEVFDNQACDTPVTAALGTKYIRVTPVAGGTYSNEATVIGTYTVAARPLSEGIRVTKGSNASSKTFTGDEISLTTASTDDYSGKDLTVKYGSTILNEGTDYEINYVDNYNVGTATYTITGKGNYTDTLSGSSYRFAITQASIVDSEKATTEDAIASILSSTLNPIYDGTQKTPEVEVKIGSTIIDELDSNNSNKANYTVSYGTNKAPGTGTITVTGTNNLTGAVVLEFTITSSTVEYSKITILNTPAVKSSESTTDGVVTRVYTCPVEMTYNGNYRTESYNVFGTDADNPLTEGTDYYAEYHNHLNAANYSVGDTANSPYLEIIGLGSYANNNAIVYFNIKPLDINNATFANFTGNCDWDGTTIPEPTVDITFNGKYLTTDNTDLTKIYGYSLKCYDAYDADNASNCVDATAKAGTKYAVYTGEGNFTGTVVKTYTVGTTLEDVKVTINSGYYSATQESWYTAEDYKDKTFDIPYRNGKAPIIVLTDSAGTALDSEAYTISKPTSSLEGLSDENLYDARPAGSDGAYNVLTYTVTPNEEKGFTGDEITLQVRINPQNISTTDTGTRMALGSDDTQSVVYTGSEQFAEPSIYFTYGSNTVQRAKVADVSSKLEQGTDFTPTEISIGTEVNSGTTVTVYGVGNFNGSQALTYQITKGYVQTRKGATVGNSILVGETSSTNLSPTYNLTDEAQEYNTVYTYDGTEHEIPPMFLTATNGTTPLELGTDYTVNYYDNGVLVTDATMSAFKTNVGVKTIEFVVTGSNYVTQTIKATYEIKSNSIENYSVKMSDVTYSGVAVTPEALKNYIENGTVTLSVAKDSETTETLTYGTDSTNGDYYIVTDTSEIANITGETAIAGSNDTPTVGGAYFYIKGNLPYSGYKKISFNIVLDISDDAVATVSIKDPSYNLEADGTVSGEGIIPVIKYKKTTDSDGTYSGNITDIATISDCVTVSRGRDKKPGPDGEITVKGKANSVCTGTVNNVKYVSGSTSADVYFLASLATFEGISLSTGTVYSFTGNAITPTVYIPGLEDVEQASVTMGDDGVPVIHTGAYGVYYVTSDGEKKKEAIAAGAWKLVIEPGSDSQYFIQGSSRTLTFNIKYNLSTATMSFDDASTDDSDGIPKVGYTGTAYSFTDNVKILAVDGSTYIYNADDDNTSLVTISPASRTLMGIYNVSVTISNADMVYGSMSPQKFKISGVGITDDDVTLAYTSTVYTGKACEPGVKVVVNGVTLTKGTDFDVTYSSNINAGTATVKVSGKGNYSGSVTKTFTITQKPLSECTIELEEAYYIGTGTGLKVEPAIKSITNGTVTLTESDYEIVGYTNSDSKATAVLNNNTEQSSWTTWPQITIKAKDGGNYSGTATQKYEIKKLDLNSSDVSISPNTTEFTGAVIDPYSVVSLTVTYNGTTTTLAKYDSSTGVGDYTITVQNSAGAVADLKAKDTYTLLIDGKNSCENTTTMSFTVTERSLPDNYHYYYTTEYAKIGTWEYKSDLYDADSDTTPGYYTIGGKDGDSLQIKVPDVETVSSTNIPAVSIIDTEAYKSDGVTLGRELINGQDFELSVTNASSAGTAAWNKDGAATEHATVASTSPAVTITGIGDYTGSITIPFNVGKNINNMGLTITYKVTGVETPYTYPIAEEKTWHYKYNGEVQRPTVVVKNGTQTLVRNKDYELTFVDNAGDENTCINAGWKNVVVTGINDYCGSISQVYAIDRKAINATGGPFTTESSMYATDDSGHNVLEFKVTGSAVKRFTADTATENLYETYLSDEEDVQKFVDFYYATYDGSDVKPSVSVYDMTLGSNGNSTMQIDEELDLSIEYPSASTVTTFDLDSDGKLAGDGFDGVHCSDIVISFQSSATSATDFGTTGNATGNYYVSTGGGNEYKIRYIILQDDVSDFVVDFNNGFDSRQFDYNEGKTIPVADYISVKKGSRILDEGIDYEVTYKTKTYTNDDGTTFKLASNILPGEGTMVVTGIGKYRSSQEITFYINGNLADTGVYSKDSEGNYVLDIPTQQYTGKGITYGDPRLYLILPAQNAHSDNPYILRAGVDYEVDTSSYSSDSNYVADGKLTYVGKTTAYWSGSKEISYGVEFDADNVRATNYEPTYYFTGYPIEPAFGLSIPTATMGEITYSTTDLTNPGTVTATIPYTIGDKSGTVTATYEILAHPLSDTDNVKIDYTKTQRYTGRAVQPRFTVYITSTDLQTGEANDPYTLTLYDEDSNTSGLYDVAYGNYIYSEGGYSDDGTMGKGQFVVSAHDGVDVISGSRTCEYNIQLQSVVALSAEDTGDTITATWVKDLFSDGTDIVLQKLNSSGEYEDKVIQRIKGDTSEYTFTDLESSSKYRVVANAYAFTPSGELIKSADSSVELTTGIAKDKLAVDTSVAGRATVTWPTTGNVKLYYIYRTEVDTGTEVLCAVIPRSTGTYTNTNAVSGKTYVYRIVGYAMVNKVLTQVNESESDPVTIQ